ncbi:MAG TPA: SDR family oxidoreductase [Protaetiibacter sp.]|nr:SDR family oxidoreductase [Protaetiibacter sp.]
MRIVVVGATGLVGRQLVARLEGDGHEVVAASPSTGVDAVTGAGLADALASAEVVIDVSKPHGYGDDAVLRYYRQSTTNLLRAGADAGVRHHVTLAAIGTDRLTDSGFYRAKRAQEQLVAASGTPFTLVRSTQFFEFAAGIADASTVDGVVSLPPVPVRPMASSEVADAVARVAIGAPRGGVTEFAGPERLTLDAFVRTVLAARGDPRRVVTDASAAYFGGRPGPDTLVPGPDAELGTLRLADWLAGASRDSP